MGFTQGRLEAAPLQELIRRRALGAGDLKGGNDDTFSGADNFRSLARKIGASLGKTQDAVHRSIFRVLAAELVTLATADEFCTALGTHVGEVWGWEVYESM